MSVCTGGRLSYQYWLNGYIRRWVYAYNTDANGECVSKDKPGKTTTLLRYDGKQYVVPKSLMPRKRQATAACDSGSGIVSLELRLI